MRLDVHLCQKLGLSRNRVQFLIDQGLVRIDGSLAKKAGKEISGNEDIVIENDKRVGYVARSAIKLAGYLEQNPNVVLQNAVCLDVGSSTGWFVQVLLEHGARQIVALDVGTAQLHESLRHEPKIISIENTDFRNFDPQGRVFDVITADVSFISLIKLLPDFARVSSAKTKLLLLFKPQFEVGPENLTKNNLPKNDTVIAQAMTRFQKAFWELGFREIDCKQSTLDGEAGNREWIFLLEKAWA